MMKKGKAVEAHKMQNEFAWKVLNSEPTALEQLWRDDIDKGRGVPQNSGHLRTSLQ